MAGSRPPFGAEQQICFVSGQPLPNLMGFHLAEPRPRKMYLVASGKMLKDGGAEALERTLSAAAPDLETRIVRLASDQPRPSEIFSVLDGIRESMPLSADFSVNVTGGTKIMSLAAVRWADERKAVSFYVDTEGKEILFLTGRGEDDAVLPIPDCLTVKDIILYNGFHFVRPDQEPGHPVVSPERRRILREILEFCLDDLGAVMSARRKDGRKPENCAASCPGSSGRRRPRRKDGRKPENRAMADFLGLTQAMKVGKTGGSGVFSAEREETRALVDLFVRAGAMSLDAESGTASFPSEAALKWCRGCWLEEYVHGVLADMHAEGSIFDWSGNFSPFLPPREGHEIDAAFTFENGGACGKERQRKGEGHEIDAAFTFENRLFLVECKTLVGSRFGVTAADVGSRLKTLGQRTGGLRSQGVMITCSDIKDDQVERLTNTDNVVICGRDLLELGDSLVDVCGLPGVAER